MNTELLNLSPKDFVDRTWPCLEGRKHIIDAPSMEAAWDSCDRVDWLLWCLGKLGATGFTDYAQWCFDRIPVGSPRKKIASGDLDLIILEEKYNAAFEAALVAVILANLSGQRANTAEIKRRWGNPFRKENKEVQP